ncbi:MAG: hypothetical protein AAGI90_04585, partial [Chlamydiota bacterium]
LVDFLDELGHTLVSHELLNSFASQLPDRIRNESRTLAQRPWNFSGLCCRFIPMISRTALKDFARYNFIPSMLITPNGTRDDQTEICFSYLRDMFGYSLILPSKLSTENLLPNPDSIQLLRFWKKYFCKFFNRRNQFGHLNRFAEKLLEHFHTIDPENSNFLEEIFSSIPNFKEAQHFANLFNNAFVSNTGIAIKKPLYEKLLLKIAERSCALQETSSPDSSVINSEYTKYTGAIKALQRLYNSCYTLLQEEKSTSAVSNTLQKNQTNRIKLKELKDLLQIIRDLENPVSLLATFYRPFYDNIYQLIEKIEKKRGSNSFSQALATKMKRFIDCIQPLLPHTTMGEKSVMIQEEDEKGRNSQRKREYTGDLKNPFLKRVKEK